jgi:hypothetical protein
LKACENPNNVFIHDDAKNDARNIFKLKTTNEILQYITNNGLENLQPEVTKIWEKNPDQSIKIYVDSYEFEAFSMKGYIAFFFNPKTSKWNIKSFHLSNKRNVAMEVAFKNIKSLK